MRRRINAQTVLSLAAIGLSSIALVRTGGSLDAATPASAGGDDGTPFNATEQRAQMIAQMREMNSRLGRVEQGMKSGVNVKVIEGNGG